MKRKNRPSRPGGKAASRKRPAQKTAPGSPRATVRSSARPSGARPSGARPSGRPQDRLQAPAGAERHQDNRHQATGRGLWLYGRHAALAALNNPERQIRRVLLSRPQASGYMDRLADLPHLPGDLPLEIVAPDELGHHLPPDSPHQGIALNCAPLPGRHLEDACAIRPGQRNLVLALDQVTDPHNVGAILRSAAAFGARALLTPDRNAPPESGALAKSASGALELIPWVRVTNLSRALERLAEDGYWRLGLDGQAPQMLSETDFGANILLVLGAEGKGLRQGTRAHCDALVKLPISARVESLNVSNAAAVALYEFSRRDS